MEALGYHVGDRRVRGELISSQDMLDELEAERWDLVPTWREEHPELIPFSVADVLYFLRCERVGPRKDLYSGTALVPFMSPQERHGLEEALGWMERWIQALEVLGITDERTPVSEP